MELWSYILDNKLILIPVLYIIGVFIKKTKKIKNRYIPMILLFIGIMLSISMKDGSYIDNIVQGILVAGATVLGNEIISQNKKET